MASRPGSTPHRTPGRDGHVPLGVVLHSTSGTFAGTIDWFARPSSRVSAHHVVALDGRVVTLVDEADTARHAGRKARSAVQFVRGIRNPNLVSIGTLLSFVIVCGAVMALRRRRPDLERPFKVPFVWVTATTGIVCAAALIALLPVATWIRLAVWLVIGLVIFFSYAGPRSRARMAQIAAEEPPPPPAPA